MVNMVEWLRRRMRFIISKTFGGESTDQAKILGLGSQVWSRATWHPFRSLVRVRCSRYAGLGLCAP